MCIHIGPSGLTDIVYTLPAQLQPLGARSRGLETEPTISESTIGYILPTVGGLLPPA